MTEQTRKGVVQLDATSTREVENDVLELTFTITKDGKDSAEVQEFLKEKVKAALEVIVPHKKPDEVGVETTGMSIQPRYGKKGELVGYWGTASIMVCGTDTATISKIGGNVTSMPIAGVSQSISRKLRESMEQSLIEEAIANFNSKAEQVTKLFNYGAYEIETVRLQVYEDGGGGYRPKGGARAVMASASLEAAPIATESGKGTITGTVNGSIIMRKE